MTPNASEPVTRDTTIGSPSKKGDVIDRKGAPPDAGQAKPETEGPTGIRGFLGLLWKTVYKFFGDGCPSLAGGGPGRCPSRVDVEGARVTIARGG